MRDAHEGGYLSKPIHYNSICAYLENPDLTPIYESLIAKSAAPLASVETSFAVDSSGFATSKFVRWFDEKYGVTRQKHAWVKLHISCGVKTHCVTAARILEKDSGDAPQFGPLVRTTAQTFTVKEVSADKGYLSHENLDIVNTLGGEPFIAFKSNSTEGEPESLWRKVFHYYKFRQQEFLDHYHKRSNVESVFSAIKRKFGDTVRSRSHVAAVNGVFGKVLCHNICCVIASHCELGIEPVFWSQKPNVQDRILPVVKRAN